MKTRVGLALASGLLFAVAGCAATGGGGAAAPSTGPMVETGQTIKVTSRSYAPVTRQFNVAVKCPGVAYLKKKGWTDQEIMQQLQLMQEQVGACQAWVDERPKGYVPPPPPGTAAAAAVEQKPAAPATKTQ